MEQQIPITAKLGNRQYRLRVPAEREEQVRQALQRIQDTSARLRKEFPGRDEQDYLAMTLMDFLSADAAVSATATPSPEPTDLQQRLQRLSQLLDL